MLAALEDMQCAVSLVVKKAFKAGRYSVADCVLLIEEGTGAIREDAKLHFESDVRHSPKGFATGFVHSWEQCLVVGGVACF